MQRPGGSWCGSRVWRAGTPGHAPRSFAPGSGMCVPSFPESMPQAEGGLTLILEPLSCQPVSQVLRWAAVRVPAAAVGTGPTGVRRCGGGRKAGEKQECVKLVRDEGRGRSIGAHKSAT